MTSVESERFEAVTAPYRAELLAHCYRMTGSAHDAEDLVQDTYLRAWRAFEGFEGRASLRTWLYRIATNVCLTWLHGRGRRLLPSGLGLPSSDPYGPVGAPPGNVAWLEPIADRMVLDESGDPAEVIAVRHSVRLALVAAGQVLPPRQRAAFFLCEVLRVTPAGAAEILDCSVGALKSLLQRARARLAEVTPNENDMAEPSDRGARLVLDRYMDAFRRSDMAALERLLADDAILEMTGTATWFSGKATCAPYLQTYAIGVPGDWEMLPLRANGQLGAATYHRGGDGTYRGLGLVVVATTTTHLKRISLFSDPALPPRFDLPADLPPR